MRRRKVHEQRERNILLAFLLNSAFALIEGVGGYFTNSLAITSNALHDLGDSISLFSAYVSEHASHRSPDEKRTFGYRRLSLIAAFVNANVLVSGSALVVWQAVTRLFRPEPVSSAGMLALSVIGIGFNVLGALRLSRGQSMSERVLRWHLLEDVFGWVAVAMVALVMLVRDLPILDPVLTILFTAVILVNAARNVRQTVNLLLEGVPDDESLAAVTARLQRAHGVANVHDIHLWSLDGEQDLLSAHVVPTGAVPIPRLLRSLKQRAERQGIEHAVFEVELEGQCAGGMEQRISSRAHPRLMPSLFFAIVRAFKTASVAARRSLT